MCLKGILGFSLVDGADAHIVLTRSGGKSRINGSRFRRLERLLGFRLVIEADARRVLTHNSGSR